MNRKVKIMIVGMLAMVSLHVKASDDKEQLFNPVNYAVISQTIAPDARGGGLGDVGVATAPDVNSQYWNPAKYPFNISRAGISLNFTPWLRSLVNDMNLSYLSGYYRIGDYSAVSASLRYFNIGEVSMSGTDEDAAAMTINPYEMSLDLAYSMMLSEKFSLAAAIRWIYSDMRFNYTEDNSPASAFAADIAAYYQNYINIGERECQLGIGMNISNIGSKITYSGKEYGEFLPANLRLGASLMIPLDEYNKLTIAADANKYLVPTVPAQREDEDNAEYEDRVHREYDDVSAISGIFKSFSDAPGGLKEEIKEINYGVGAEYVYNEKFALRAGYHHESQSKGNRKYFTMGAGFKMSVFSLDAAYVVATAKSNPLDQTLRFTLSFDMDGIKDLVKRR